MRKVCLILLMMLSLFPLRAQDSEALKQRISASGAAIQSIQCSFVQTKQSALLSDKAVSTGMMHYKRPDYLSWAYETPMTSAFVLDGESISAGRDGHLTPLDANRGRMVREIARLIAGSIEGGILQSDRAFSSTAEDTGTEIVVTLTPLRRDLKKLFAFLVLGYSRDGRCAHRVEMHEASGDVTIIEFKNPQINRD